MSISGKKIRLQFLFTLIAMIVAMTVWQLLFRSHRIVSGILWEIHTIFSSVVVFYAFVAFLLPAKALAFVKILVRLIFKVWIVIFIASRCKKLSTRPDFYSRLLSFSVILKRFWTWTLGLRITTVLTCQNYCRTKSTNWVGLRKASFSCLVFTFAVLL